MEATAINNRGQIVGVASSESAPGIPVMWEHGRVVNLKTRGLPGTADGINDHGAIVGALQVQPGKAQGHAYVWRAGSWHRLAGLNSPASAAYGINSRGEVVGVQGKVDSDGRYFVDPELFRWEGCKVTRLGIRTRYEGEQRCAVNNRGVVVGTFSWPDPGPDPLSRVALLRVGRKRQLLWLGGPHNVVGGINNRGQVVGRGYFEPLRHSGDFGDFHAVLWERGGYTRLDRLIPRKSCWETEQANGINNRGQIVGYGQYRGRTRAFLMTPTR